MFCPVATYADVLLTPRVDDNGTIVASEDYVYFGSFKHKLGITPVGYETSATPILWRVMSADVAENPKQATMLSHYLLDEHRYDHKDPVVWQGSEMQIWLNSTTNFLSDFTASEKSAIVSPSPDDIPDSMITLPSFRATNDTQYFNNWIYHGDVAAWFGDNDLDGTGWDISNYTFGPNSLARRAHFKGINFEYDSNNLGYGYWSRTPYPGTNIACGVGEYGEMEDSINVSGSDNLPRPGVRPMFVLDLESVLFKAKYSDFMDYSSTDEGGTASNPFVLFVSGGNSYGIQFTSAELAPTSTKMDAYTLTLTFEEEISPAIKSLPQSGDFSLRRVGAAAMHPTNVAIDTDDEKKLILTFADPVASGAAVSLDYNMNYDAIAFDIDTVNNTAKVMASFSDMAISNLPPSDDTTPTEISITIGGDKYTAMKLDGTSYLIVLPEGTDSSVLESLSLNIVLPGDATIAPDPKNAYDFSGSPVAFTVTAENGDTSTITIDIKIAVVIESEFVTGDGTLCQIGYTYNADGTVSVEIRLPVTADFDPTELYEMAAEFVSPFVLRNVSYAYVDADGNVMLLQGRGAEAAYLRITGTADSREAIQSAKLSSVSYWLIDNSYTEYCQTFDIPLPVSDMQVIYVNNAPHGSGSGVGCDAGLGAFALLSLASALAMGSIKKRK